MEATEAANRAKEQAAEARADSAALRAKLDAIQSQMKYEGPVINTYAWMSRWNSDQDRLEPLPWEQPVPISRTNDLEEYLDVVVENRGRFRTTLTSVYLQSAEQSWQRAEGFYCLNELTHRFVDCGDDARVEPDGMLTLRVRLDDEQSVTASCSPMNASGIHYRVYSRSADPVDGVTSQKPLCT